MPETAADDLIDSLHALADDLGRPPTSRDATQHADESLDTFRNTFGSWSEALEAAGFDVQRSGQRLADEDLLADLRRLADELGHPPTIAELREHGRFSISPHKDHFGSWNAALEAAGLESRSSSRLSREALIAELQHLADELGHPPTQSDMNEHGQYSAGPYHRAFDSWADALEAAGLESAAAHPNKAIPEEALRDELHRLDDDLGHTPTIAENREHGRFSAGPYDNRFGSWTDALEAAALEPQSPGKLSRETLITELHRLADDLGHPPTLQEQKEQGSHSAKVYYDRFGSWRDALEAAGFESREPQEAIPKQALIEELQRLGDDLGHQPTLPDMNEHGEYWGSTYKNHFESWAAAIEAAGFDPEKISQKIGRDALREELVRLGESLGKRPTYREMAAEGAYDPKTYSREYGSWRDALEAAAFEAPTGFEPPSGVREDDLRAELERLAGELGKQPSQRDMNNHGKHSHTTCVRQYGSWSKALDAVFGSE